MGNRMDYIRRGVVLLGRDLGVVRAMSSVYETEPWGFDHPCRFLNRAVALDTDCPAGALLDGIQRIERELGRVRTPAGGYRARTADIDILLYGNCTVNIPGLIIPHPRMTERMFVLKPLAELAPNLMHPVLHQTVEYLRNHCTDTLEVRRIFDLD